MSTGDRIVFAIVAAVFAVLIRFNLVSGRIVTSMIKIERRNQPYGFWMIIGLQGFVVVAGALLAALG